MALLTLTDGSGGSIVLDVEVLEKVIADYRKCHKPSDDLKELDKTELAEVTALFDRPRKKTGETVECCGLRKKGSPIEPNEPALPDCYEEIKNLLDIEQSPIYSKALEEWSRKETLLTGRVERKKKKVDNLKNEIYQLIGFFSVFQGVLLTAVSQSNLLHCNNWWSPIILSVAASAVTVAGVIQKLWQIRSFQETIHSEEQSLKEVARRLTHLRRVGVDKFKFAKFANINYKEQSTHRFWLYFFGVIGSLVIFAVVFPFSHWRISCDPGRNPYGK